MIRRSFVAAFGVALIALAPMGASAQNFPDRPVKLVLPFPAGSATDGAARYVADELRKSLGQAVVVENMAGADGIIATQHVRRAAPDGYTLLMSTNSAHGANRALYNTLPYDPEKDFGPVAGVIRIPLTLVVRKDFPAEDVAGFVKVAQQRAAANKPLNFGSGNTSSQLGGALMKSATKAEMVHVPYRGTPQALQDLLGGQIEVMVVDPFSSMGFVNSGQLKVLAVADRGRHPLLPNVPTMAEAGFQGVEIVTWAAVFAPAKTDPLVVERLNREINRILARPEAKEAVLKMAMTPMIMSPAELRAYVTSEITHWGRLVELAGIPKK
jgi:tripartite-type tricarboxylate transporter receptor subunit TctC